MLSTEGTIKSVAKILRDCHALKPRLRPSAAFVAEKLFDLLSSEVMDMPPYSDDPEDAKTAVLLALEAHAKHASNKNDTGDVVPQIDQAHWSRLEQLHFRGDPIASMLMGQIIWKGLRTTDPEGSQVVLACGRDACESKKRKSIGPIDFANT
jgi:hypothetical protein